MSVGTSLMPNAFAAATASRRCGGLDALFMCATSPTVDVCGMTSRASSSCLEHLCSSHEPAPCIPLGSGHAPVPASSPSLASRMQGDDMRPLLDCVGADPSGPAEFACG